MITYRDNKNAQKILIKCWKEQGKKVIEECSKVNPFNNTCKEFLNHCVCYGGNVGQILLTGIKELYPNVYEVIPEKMGHFTFVCIVSTLILCGIAIEE